MRREGGTARPPPSRSLSSSATRPGASPAANRRSASRRSSGHAYDPGRPRPAGGPTTRARCARSARSLARVMHPAAAHARESDATKSRPARLVWNSTLRCAAHSHTETPDGRCSSARSPSPTPMHSRHGGRFPSRSPL